MVSRVFTDVSGEGNDGRDALKFCILKFLLRKILHYKLQKNLPNKMNTVVHYNNISCNCISNIKVCMK